MDENTQKALLRLQHENNMLKNRCSALTEGTMCQYCPYTCVNRSEKYRGNTKVVLVDDAGGENGESDS